MAATARADPSPSGATAAPADSIAAAIVRGAPSRNGATADLLVLVAATARAGPSPSGAIAAPADSIAGAIGRADRSHLVPASIGVRVQVADSVRRAARGRRSASPSRESG